MLLRTWRSLFLCGEFHARLEIAIFAKKSGGLDSDTAKEFIYIDRWPTMLPFAVQLQSFNFNLRVFAREKLLHSERKPVNLPFKHA